MFHGYLIRMFILLWFHGAFSLCHQIMLVDYVLYILADFLHDIWSIAQRRLLQIYTNISVLVSVTIMGSYYIYIASCSSHPTMPCEKSFPVNSNNTLIHRFKWLHIHTRWYECTGTHFTIPWWAIYFFSWVALFPMTTPLAFSIAVLSFDNRG